MVGLRARTRRWSAPMPSQKRLANVHSAQTHLPTCHVHPSWVVVETLAQTATVLNSRDPMRVFATVRRLNMRVLSAVRMMASGATTLSFVTRRPAQTHLPALPFRRPRTLGAAPDQTATVAEPSDPGLVLAAARLSNTMLCSAVHGLVSVATLSMTVVTAISPSLVGLGGPLSSSPLW